MGGVSGRIVDSASQVIEHRELNAVWTELLSSGGKHGNAVLMKDPPVVPAPVPVPVPVPFTSAREVEQREGEERHQAEEEEEGRRGATSTFNQLAEEAALRNEVLIGYKTKTALGGESIVINPDAGREPAVPPLEGFRVVVRGVF